MSVIPPQTPNDFRAFVNLMAIVKVLATLRARRASLAHAHEFYVDNFGSKEHDVVHVPEDGLEALLPSRRDWSRPRLEQRGGKGRTKETILRDSIIRKVQGVVTKGRLGDYEWGRRLWIFAKNIFGRIERTDYTFHRPRVFLRQKCSSLSLGTSDFRCLATFENLEDRVILTLANKYLLSRVDPTFSDCSYAFRATKPFTYNTAVHQLQRYRRKHQGVIYVANCDIKQFFDAIPHQFVREAVGRRSAVLGSNFLELIDGYLAAYDFAWAAKDIRNTSPNYASQIASCQQYGEPRRGLPQGGTLSAVLANLVLDDLDHGMTLAWDPHLFYARYCDDIIIAHIDKGACEWYLKSVLKELDKLGLSTHDLHYVGTYSADFYKAKSRLVYAWASPRMYADTIPWIPFLGYCIDYEGNVRIRKESLQRHRQAMVDEFAFFKQRLYECERRDSNWLERVVSQFIVRMMRKSVGSIDARHAKVSGHCWLSAFPLLCDTDEVRKQMRYLDQWRMRLISNLMTDYCLSNQTFYLGYPFSYVGALKNATRWKLTRKEYYKLATRPSGGKGQSNEQNEVVKHTIGELKDYGQVVESGPADPFSWIDEVDPVVDDPWYSRCRYGAFS